MDRRYLAAALSALAVLFIGGVNAADTIDILIVLFFTYYETAIPAAAITVRLVDRFVALATMWWVIPLLLLGKYGFIFLRSPSSRLPPPRRCPPPPLFKGPATGSAT